jgi:hypothetical protein
MNLKNISRPLLILVLLTFSGCGDQSEKGYQDAWNSEKNIILYSFSPTYQEGHQKGREEVLKVKPLSDAMKQTKEKWDEAVKKVQDAW